MNQSDAELYIQFIESIHDVVATLHQVRTQQRAWQVAPFFIDDSGDEIKGTKGGGVEKGEGGMLHTQTERAISFVKCKQRSPH